MVNNAYLDMLEDDQQDALSRETEIFSEAQSLIKHCMTDPADKIARVKAIHFNQRMWNVLIDDLADNENQHAAEFKAQLISVGIFVLKHLQEMRNSPDIGFGIIPDINTAIQNGLEGAKS